MVRLLLEAGADVAVRSLHEGQKGTPFEIARALGNEEIAKLLIAGWPPRRSGSPPASR